MPNWLTRLASIGIFVAALSSVGAASSQSQDGFSHPLSDTSGLRAIGVVAEPARFDGRDAIKLTMESDFAGGDSNTIAILEGSDFANGTIEFDLASGINPDSWFFVKWIARGFAGIAFRVDSEASGFESLYLRPENGPADDPVRRGHAVQYFAYPDWDFQRFRDEAPERYEAPAPIAPDRWIHVRVEVDGSNAKLFVDDVKDPVLEVTDLKLGPDRRGAVALFIDMGTRAYFSNLRITPRR